MVMDISGKRIITTIHAYQKMMERSISKGEIMECIQKGMIIRRYDDTKPFPAVLVSGVVNGRVIHVNFAVNERDNAIVIITAYEPDPELWDDTYSYKVNT